jgi:hypothetical protein
VALLAQTLCDGKRGAVLRTVQARHVDSMRNQ